MALILDGTTGIVANNIADYAISTAKLANSAVTVAKMGHAGATLQVVQGVKTDTFTSAVGSTWTDITGLTATITPNFSSSKILVQVSTFGVFWTMSYNGLILRILRNDTNIGGGDASGSRSSVMGTIAFGNSSKPDCAMQYAWQYIDSPASTSALTYKIQFYQDTPGNPIYVNRTIVDTDGTLFPRTVSTITLTEISA
jgi:hypothetical protein